MKETIKGERIWHLDRNGSSENVKFTGKHHFSPSAQKAPFSTVVNNPSLQNAVSKQK